MKTLTTAEKRTFLHPDWETIIRSTRIKPSNKTGNIQKPTSRQSHRDMELVCVKLKNDLEWYCNLPDKTKSKAVLRNILDDQPIQSPQQDFIEKWWLLS